MLKRLAAIALSLSLIFVFTSCQTTATDPADKYDEKNSFEDLTFELPEGYDVYLYEGWNPVSYKKLGGSTFIDIMKVDQLEIDQWRGEDAEMGEETPYATPEEYFAHSDPRGEGYDGPTEIAGHDGYVDRATGEDGKLYSAIAKILIDDVVYQINMYNHPDYAEVVEIGEAPEVNEVPLTDEELATFDAFIASIKTK